MKAKVVISFDFEIGWGDVTNERWRVREKKGVYRNLRVVLPKILNTMVDLEVSASWASVGAMIDAPSERSLDYLPEKARSIVDNSLKEADECSFDGRDLFEMVISAKRFQEVISHSYAHVPYYYEGVDCGFVMRDCKEVSRAFHQWGLETKKFVFPENREGYYDALASSGIEHVRVAAENRFSNRWLYLATIGVVAPPLSVNKNGEAGIVKHTGSMLFNDAGNSSRIPLLRRRLNLGLRSLTRHGGTLHIWAHPFNFAESAPLLSELLAMFETLAQYRDSDLITIECM